jgi:tetratricopeptide (TPR) repeat protein
LLKTISLIFLLLLSLGAPAQAQLPSLEVNQSLFVVMSAINAAGYDVDLENTANSPVRAAVRQYLAQKKLPVLENLKEFYALRRKPSLAQTLSQYVSFALCIELVNGEKGPEFRYRYRIADLPPDVQEMDGFELLMTRFYRESGIGDLFQRNQAALDHALEPYGAPVALAFQQIDGYLRNPRINNYKGSFKVFLDVMAAPNQIQVKSYGNELFVILSPSPEPQIDYIRSAYLHFMVEPITLRFLSDILEKKSLADYAQGAPALETHYKEDFVLLTTNCLVKAIEARMAPQTRRAAMIDSALKEGFILTPYFSEALILYEKQDQSMRLYLQEMVQAIDLRKEVARLDGIKFASAPATRKARPSPQRAPVEKSPAEKTMDEAEALYAEKKYPAAGELYRRAVTETHSRILQARAYFGLGRVAALSKDPELAVQMFEKTIDLEAEPPIRAQAYVYLGRLMELANEPDVARRHFESALATDGAAPASRRAAEEALKNLKPSGIKP